MSFVAGDLKSGTYNHPKLGQGTIYFKGNESGTVDPGGYRMNDDANSVSGSGEMIIVLNRVLTKIECPPVCWDSIDRNELFKMRDLAGDPENADWTLESISGAVWSGRGRPIGDIQGDTNAGTFTLTLGFENELKEIS